MPQRLFQDPAGTIPAILAGQPVGLAVREDGSADASQATALSKPTLARHPKSGVRNLADGAQAVDNNAYWRSTYSSIGLNATKVGSGVEGGLPYVDYDFTGVTTGTSLSGFFATTRFAASQGEEFNTRVKVKLLSGIFPSASFVRAETVWTTADGSYVGQAPVSPQVVPSGVYQESKSGGALAMPTANRARPSVTISFAVGVEVNFRLRFAGLQLERGLVQTPLQFNYGPNDIVEAGVADLWHLYNDGGDSLNVTLPAGTYGLASIDINRAITIGTIVSDGSTPINTLLHERQPDVILREGAFSPAEEVAIRSYWAKEFPL